MTERRRRRFEDDGAVRLRKAPFTLETAYGSVKALEEDRDLADIIRMAKEEKAAVWVDEMNEL